MAERSRGPVKPPVLDMKAKGKDEAPESGAAKPDEAPRKRSSKPLMPIGPWAAAGIGVAGGAVIGVILVIVLAFAGLLPGGADESVGQRLNSVEESVAQSAASVSALGDRVDGLTPTEDAVASVQAETDALSALATTLEGRISDLENAPAPEQADLTPIEERISQLSDRLEAIAAGASSEDADALAGSLNATRDNVAALDGQVSDLSDALDARDEMLASLLSQIEGLRSEMAQQEAAAPAVSESLLRVPLILSNIEAAVAAGRPFANELGALSTFVPDVTPSAELTVAADAGLPLGSEVAARFADRVPEVMAAKPANPDAAWQDAALERLQALLAIRPAGEAEGNTPEAIVARLEAALARRDHVAAKALFDALPEPMQAAAGDVGDDIGLLATAEGFVAEARSSALGLVSAETGN